MYVSDENSLSSFEKKTILTYNTLTLHTQDIYFDDMYYSVNT